MATNMTNDITFDVSELTRLVIAQQEQIQELESICFIVGLLFVLAITFIVFVFILLKMEKNLNKDLTDSSF